MKKKEKNNKVVRHNAKKAAETQRRDSGEAG